MIIGKKFNKLISTFMLSENQIFLALVSALLVSILAIRLGSALYK